jgi:hypothetical protein
MIQYKKTEIVEFLYESDEEKIKHKKEMEQMGYEDSGKRMIDISQSLKKPEWKLYGKYFRYNYI